MSFSRKVGEEQAALCIELYNDGVNVDVPVFKNLDYDNTYAEQIRAGFDMNYKTYVESKIPAAFRFKTTGFLSKLIYNPSSQISIIPENGKYYLVRSGKDVIDEVYFEHKPKFYNKKTSDGKDMSRIVQANSKGRVGVTYSNECALLEGGKDCLFCNLNATKRNFAQFSKIEWKNPRQIGESVAEAYREGYRGYNLTGGFVPERREVEYYLDVIEEVIDSTGTSDVHGMACVGAPKDLSIIEMYKEAGYQHIATNIEIWDENMFKTICPGKNELCGGRENWLNVLKHEVEVFGKGNVRSQLVGGIEPKDSLLEGIEYLSSIGVIAYPTIWRPSIGSALEGHRSPTNEWHREVAEKTYQIHKKYGFTLEQYYYVNGDDNLFAYYHQLDGESLPWEEKLDIVD